MITLQCIQTHTPPSCLWIHLFSTAHPGSEPRVQSGLFLKQKQYVAVLPPLMQKVQSPCWSAHTQHFSCTSLCTYHCWVCWWSSSMCDIRLGVKDSNSTIMGARGMPMHTALIRFVHPGNCFISIDLKYAYFHSPIYPRTKNTILPGGIMHEYLVLPFSLSISPRVFVKCTKSAILGLMTLAVAIVLLGRLPMRPVQWRLVHLPCCILRSAPLQKRS